MKVIWFPHTQFHDHLALVNTCGTPWTTYEDYWALNCARCDLHICLCETCVKDRKV